MDQLPRFGKIELIFLLLRMCNYLVSVWRDFLFLLVLAQAMSFYCGTLWAFCIINSEEIFLKNVEKLAEGCQNTVH